MMHNSRFGFLCILLPVNNITIPVIEQTHILWAGRIVDDLIYNFVWFWQAVFSFSRIRIVNECEIVLGIFSFYAF